MFEYDLVLDTLSIYHSVETNGKNNLNKTEITNFISRLKKTKYIHLDDIEEITDLIHKKNKHSIEVRGIVRDEWRWLRVQCSPIKNNENQIIEIVGSIKDITEEKIKVQTLMDLAQRDSLTKLMNQTSSKERITQYLLETNK